MTEWSYDEAIARGDWARTALARIHEVGETENEQGLSDFSSVLRMVLTTLPEMDAQYLAMIERDLSSGREEDKGENEAQWFEEVVEIVRALRDNAGFDDQYNTSRDDVSHLCMTESLCPIHFVDWAICFDDEDEECSQVRAIYPTSHDT